MPREKKYKSVRAFETAVNAYFDYVSILEPMTFPKLAGYTAKGKPKYSYIPIFNDDGSPRMRRCYLSTPNMYSMCLFLEISKPTWSRYAKLEGYKDVVEKAKLEIEAYLAEALMTNDKVDGIKFNLKYNYGWEGK